MRGGDQPESVPARLNGTRKACCPSRVVLAVIADAAFPDLAAVSVRTLCRRSLGQRKGFNAEVHGST